MSTPDFLDGRRTERRNPRTVGIDVATTLEIVDLLNAEDRHVPDAVHAARHEIAAVADLAVRAFRAGGRLLYVGAGTSGRLGVLDASECPPTFGTRPEMVVGIIAGGPAALVQSQERAEDDEDAARRDLDGLETQARDLVVGVAASGTTPYVRAALEHARELGAATALVTCADPSRALAAQCDAVVTLMLGPEALAGSTRLKSGTATKVVLNAISTAAMLRLGKAYGNLMVDLQTWSAKLQDRGERIVMEVCGVRREEARRVIESAGGSVKRAIVMQRRDVDAAEADRLLAEADGVVRAVIGDPPPVSE